MRNGWRCGNLTSSELNVASSDITLSSPLIVISTDSPFITYTPHEAFNLMCNFSFLHWSFQYRLEFLSFVSILKHICHCVNLNRKRHRFPLSLRCCVNVCTPVYVFPLTTVTFRSTDIRISRSNGVPGDFLLLWTVARLFAVAMLLDSDISVLTTYTYLLLQTPVTTGRRTEVVFQYIRPTHHHSPRLKLTIQAFWL